MEDHCERVSNVQTQTVHADLSLERELGILHKSGERFENGGHGSAPERLRRGCINLECLRIEDNAIIASRGFERDVAVEDILPHQLGIAAKGLAPSSATCGGNHSRSSLGNQVTHQVHRIELVFRW